MWFGSKLRCIKRITKQIQDKQSTILGLCKVSGNHSNTYGAACKETIHLQRHTNGGTLQESARVLKLCVVAILQTIKFQLSEQLQTHSHLHFQDTNPETISYIGRINWDQHDWKPGLYIPAKWVLQHLALWRLHWGFFIEEPQGVYVAWKQI